MGNKTSSSNHHSPNTEYILWLDSCSNAELAWRTASWTSFKAPVSCKSSCLSNRRIMHLFWWLNLHRVNPRPAQKSSAPHRHGVPRTIKSMQSNVSNVSNPFVAEPSFFTIWLLVSLALPPNWLGTSRRVYNVIWFNQLSLCASTIRPA